MSVQKIMWPCVSYLEWGHSTSYSEEAKEYYMEKAHYYNDGGIIVVITPITTLYVILKPQNC